MTTFDIAVTYEFMTRPPLTHRMTVEAGHEAMAVRGAIRKAKAMLKPREWTSMVAVVLDRHLAEEKE